MRLTILFLMMIFLFSCESNQNTMVNTARLNQYFNYGDSIEGGGVKLIPIHTEKGDFKVWTKRFGSNTKIKILLLHGGPALTHEYMECFETFFQQQGFEFYEYDQLGSFYSD